jgi:hypothetical protein
MSKTPEGNVKEAVKKILAEFGVAAAAKVGGLNKGNGWYFMPGQNQYGVSGIPDFVGHVNGYFFAIETKAPGKKPTGLQALQLATIAHTGAKAFVVDGSEGSLAQLRTFLRGGP